MNTYLEEFIYNLYRSHGITKPEQLDMFQIAAKLGVDIIYRNTFFRLDNEIILAPGTREDEWMSFGHEICHFLRHCGNQASLHPLFIELQEWQADNFAYHFCVPTFMLDRINLPANLYQAADLIAHTFNVDRKFAVKRLDRYYQKVLIGGVYNG